MTAYVPGCHFARYPRLETQVLQAPLALGEAVCRQYLVQNRQSAFVEAEFLGVAELPVREKRRLRAVDGDCLVKATDAGSRNQRDVRPCFAYQNAVL